MRPAGSRDPSHTRLLAAQERRDAQEKTLTGAEVPGRARQGHRSASRGNIADASEGEPVPAAGSEALQLTERSAGVPRFKTTGASTQRYNKPISELTLQRTGDG